MMPDNINQNLRRGGDSLPLFHCFVDHRLRSNEKVDQRLARRQRFLKLPNLCIAESGNVTNEFKEPVLQHSLPRSWLYARAERCCMVLNANSLAFPCLSSRRTVGIPCLGSFARTSSASA